MLSKHFRASLNVLAFILLFASASAQRIFYSEPEKDDTRRTNFDIIGKVGGNILIFKNNRNDYTLSAYTNEMKLVNTLNVNPNNDKYINVDFVPYADNVWMIYQYQQKNILYCMAVKIDANGKMLSRPLELDTTRVGNANDNKIYTTVFSEDKEKIMIFKINNKNQSNFIFTTLLFDKDLHLTEKHQLNMPMEEKNDYFTDFLLDNEGTLVFGKYVRKTSNDYVTDLKLVLKSPGASQFTTYDLKTGDRVLDEVKIKIDNKNKRYVFAAFYYRQKRGNIEGLYLVSWDRGSSSVVKEHLRPFTDEMRQQAKGPDANLKIAFNDYFIKNFAVKKDGGYIVVAESMYTSNRGGGAFNRWDYMGWNNPWASPFNSYYYSPYSYYYGGYGSPYNRWGGSPTRYHAENIMIFSFDVYDSLKWSNVIPKTQFDDQTDGLISYQVMNTGGELHFLFNNYEKRALLLNDQSIDADGKITRKPTLRNLDRNIDFMPRYGKQVSQRSIVMPCQYKNYLIFAKIDL
ncbi:MAG: hypothetical protein J7497_08955 [Chitinophagaceae bacterium]|nr:hypothetical protein [Chitinophagaceae bacterium]